MASYLASIKREKIVTSSQEYFERELFVIIEAALAWKRTIEENGRPPDMVNSIHRKLKRIYDHTEK